MKSSRSLSALIAAVLTVYGSSDARSPDAGVSLSYWTRLGPYGGSVTNLSVSPSDATLVFAGLDGLQGNDGLYRSVDGGVAWSPVETFSGRAIVGIEYNSEGALFVATKLNGLWKSEDDGATWARLELGLDVDHIHDLALDPNDPGGVWICLGPVVRHTVLRSTDGGDTWQDAGPFFESGSLCNAVLVHPADSDTIYTLSGFDSTAALWVSHDGGGTWDSRREGLPFEVQVRMTKSVIAHDGSRVVIGGGRGGTDAMGLYVSADDGETWEFLADATWPTLAIQEVVIDSAFPDVIYVGSEGYGLYRSTDGGASWDVTIRGTENLYVREIELLPDAPDALLLGSTLGVLQGHAPAAPFVLTSTGIRDLSTTDVAVNPVDPSEIAVSFEELNSGGVFTSEDGGRTWSLATGLPMQRVRRVAFSPGGELFAASDGPRVLEPVGLYRRSEGQGWEFLGPDEDDARLRDILFSASNPSRLVAAGEAGIWLSDDGGRSWDRTLERGRAGTVQEVEFVPGTGETSLVATFSIRADSEGDGGVLHSSDEGRTWREVSVPPGFQGRALCRVDGEPPRLLAGTANLAVAPAPGGLYRSTDGGQTWQVVQSEYAVEELLCAPGFVYAAGPENLLRGTDETRLVSFSRGIAAALTRGSRLAVAGGAEPRVLLSTGRGLFASALCADSPEVLCLNDQRFRLTVRWADFEGTVRPAKVVPTDLDDSGIFRFLDPDNWEMLVKVLDGCGLNDRFWVFAAATTNVGLELEVTDTWSGLSKVYRNPLGQPARTITDTDAFAVCP